VFAVGPHGVLVAADEAAGRERWRHDLVRDFGATPPTWGFAASPLVEGPLVIVPTGGEKSRGLLAFDRARGTLAWNVRLDQQPAYTSAVVAVIGGVRQILAASPNRLFAGTPADGRVLWSTALAGPGVDLANSPIVIEGDRVLVLFWEDARLLRVRRNGGKAWSVDEVWRTPRLRGAFGPVGFRDGFFYGFAGEFLTCLNAETTDVAWRERFGAGRLIAVGDHLAILGETSGELTVAQIHQDDLCHPSGCESSSRRCGP
jgi:outer membrane protein assembly factor BamB